MTSVLDHRSIGDAETVAATRPPSRRFRDVVRRHPFSLLSAVGAVLLLVGLRHPATGAVVALLLATVPGVFLVDLVAPRGRMERLVVIWATSLTTWIVVAHLMLTFQWWEPRWVSAWLLIAAAVVGWQVESRHEVPDRPPHAGGATHSIRAWARRVGRTQLAWSAASLALWLGSLTVIDLGDMSDWGLVSVLPPTFFAAFAIAIVVAASAAVAPTTNLTRVTAAVLPLLAMVYATLPLLTGTIRYPWAYKHVGVIRLLDETGRLHPDVDIYNHFSGFFGLGALLRGATGIDPTSYAAWTQFVAEGLTLVAVWLLVRRATDSERVAHLAAVLYLITNWVGQNYFAAQTLATLLSLTILGLVTSWFLGGRTRRMPFMGASIGRIAPRSADVGPPVALAARRSVVLVAFLGLMMTHPLTPAATLGPIVLAWILGWLRDRVVLAGFGIIAVAWLVRCYTYFADRDFSLGFGGSPSQNADGNLDYSGAPDVVVMVGNLTRMYSAGLWLLALVGALLCAWAMRRTGVLIAAAAIPFGIPFVQSYGGEAIYRVYLYSLPLIVAFVAWGIMTVTPIERRHRLSSQAVLAPVVALVLGAGFLVAHYGRERINTVDASEVAMGEYVAATIEGQALIAQFDGGFPAASSARYPEFQLNDTYDPTVIELSAPAGVMPTAAQLDAVADEFIGFDFGPTYVIVSPGTIESVEQLGTLPIHTTQEAVDLMLTSDRYAVRHRIGDTWLLEVLA